MWQRGRGSLRWLRKLHLHTAHSERVKQSAWYLADNAANADADADIHHRSAEAQTGPAKTDGRQREMLRAPRRQKPVNFSAANTRKLVGRKRDWNGERDCKGDWHRDWDEDRCVCVCVCAWQRHWHKSLDRKRCKPCCAHNNFYVAIKRRLLPRRFVCPFGFWLLPLLLALPLHSLARDEAIANWNRNQLAQQAATATRQRGNKTAPALSSAQLIISCSSGLSSSAGTAGQSAAPLCAVPVPDPDSSCVSALVEHRPQRKYVELLCSFFMLCTLTLPKPDTCNSSSSSSEGAPKDSRSGSSGNAAEIIISACHICFSMLLLRSSFCARCKGLGKLLLLLLLLCVGGSVCLWVSV